MNRNIDYGNIRLLVLDVDGVLTDGRIILTPDGGEIKIFHDRDGAAMRFWKRAGGKLAIISGRSSQAIVRRAEECDVDVVRLGAKQKLPVYLEVLREMDIPARHTAVVGDDVGDLPLLMNCGFPVAVADAVEELKHKAVYVTRLGGGTGCVRELVEMILKKTGKWKQIMQRYNPPNNADRNGGILQ